jgi:hypothetical protein
LFRKSKPERGDFFPCLPDIHPGQESPIQVNHSTGGVKLTIYEYCMLSTGNPVLLIPVDLNRLCRKHSLEFWKIEGPDHAG